MTTLPGVDLSGLAALVSADPDSSRALQDRATQLIQMAFDEAEDLLTSGSAEVKLQLVRSLVTGVARTPKDDAQNSEALKALTEMNEHFVRLLSSSSSQLPPPPDDEDADVDVLVDGVEPSMSDAQRSIAKGVAVGELENPSGVSDPRDLPPGTESTAPKRRKREPGRTRTGSVRSPNRTVKP